MAEHEQRDGEALKKAFGISFDPTVNAGHIITTVALLVSLVIWGTRLEGRVNHEADLRQRIENKMSEDSQRDRETVVELKRYMQRMEDKIDRIQQSVSAR